METHQADVSGIPMRWYEEGDGLPVIYLHGIPTSPALWRDVIARVRGARSMAWELIGYGASIAAGRDRDISVARQAEYLEQWMQHVGIGEAVLVGHDLGGGIAQTVAVRSPEHVRGLVLTNCVSYDAWPIPMAKVLRTGGILVEQLPNSVFKTIFTTFMYQAHAQRGRAEEAIATHWPHYEAADEPGATAFVRQLRSMDVRDTLAIADRIPELDLPARIVWGAADRFLQIGYGYRLAHELGAPLDRIEEGKHYVPEDYPDRLSAAINDLLESLEEKEETESTERQA